MKKALIFVLSWAVLFVWSCASGPSGVAGVTPTPVPKVVVKDSTVRLALPSKISAYYPNGDLSGTTKTVYNEKGYLLSQESYNANALLQERRSGAAKGKDWRVTVFAQTGEVLSFEDLSYDVEGNVLLQVFRNSKEEPQASNEYIYKNGKKTEWLARTGPGTLQARTVYLYDDKGNNTRTELYDGGGKLTGIYESVFSPDGHIVSKTGKDSAGTVAELIVYNWSGDRKTKEETQKPVLKAIEYQYGADDAANSIITSFRGKVVEKQVLEYQWITKTVKASN